MKNLIARIKSSKLLSSLLVALVLVIILGGVYFYLKRINRVFIDDSLVEAPIITIAPVAPGQITNIFVDPGDSVKKGDQLAEVGGQVLNAQTDGLIISTDNQPGSLASSQTPVVQMIDPNQMKIVGTVDETKGLDKIQTGQSASFTVDALPGQTFWGYVDHVAPSAKVTQAAFSISSERPTQQFEVSVAFPATEYPQIKNGMSAKLTVFTSVP